MRQNRYEKSFLDKYKLRKKLDEAGLVTSGYLMTKYPSLYKNMRLDVKEAYIKNYKKYVGKGKNTRLFTKRIEKNLKKNVNFDREMMKYLRNKKISKKSFLGRYAYDNLPSSSAKTRGSTKLLISTAMRDANALSPKSYVHKNTFKKTLPYIKGKKQRTSFLTANRKALKKIILKSGVKGVLLTIGTLGAYPLALALQSKYKKGRKFNKRLKIEVRQGVTSSIKALPADYIRDNVIGDKKYLYNSRTVRKKLGKMYGYKGSRAQYWGRRKGVSYADEQKRIGVK